MQARPLTDSEASLLAFLIEGCSEGGDQLREQARDVRTAGSSCDCGCPSFYLNANRGHSPAVVEEPVPVSAHGVDPGNNQIGVLLFVTDGYLREVEVYSEVGDTYAGLPRPEDLEISVWSQPDEHGVSRRLNAD